MSMELYVATASPMLPSADQIAAALKAKGISLVIEPIDWDQQTGFLPMLLNGAATGVEVDAVAADECAEILAPFGGAKSGERRVIAFRWGGELSECACAFGMAWAIASLVRGRVLDPQEGAEVSSADALSQARDCIKELA